VNKLIVLLIALIFLNNCSLNENSRIWNSQEKLKETNNTKKIFEKKKKVSSVFNQSIKLDLSKIKDSNKIFYNLNNFGSQTYKGELDKIGKYKFSKWEDEKLLSFKPVFLSDGIIYFDKKGTIIRYNENQKIIWKQNHYSKSEKKLQPKLNFLLDGQNLLITDNIAKYYSINIKTGELNWSRINTYPFNSGIKKYKDKAFVVDYKNTLRCFKIKDGSECWNLQTEDSFTISNTKYSLVIIENNVIFSNSIGDITAVDIQSGLISWQLPTQSSSIINETYNFKISKLISDGKTIFFSNNKNQFYAIDVKTGTIKWINEINSNITPAILGNLIITISNDGFLFVVEKNKGNFIRVTDLYANYKDKKRKNINPEGFMIGNKKLYLTNSDGKLIVVDLSIGQVSHIEKVSSSSVSEPYIFNNHLYIVRNGSVIKYK
tara:strand:- start:161 stop:1456 length:1296 start_codon:yes stop_codon:yes gene_type:complete